MKKQIICVLVASLIASINKESAAQKIKLLKRTHLTDFPSASSLEFYKEKLYVIGDDAASIWILDKEHQFLDSIVLFPSKNKRLDKMIKADLEASAIITKNNKNYLAIFSSFSTSNRNQIFLIDLENPGNKLSQLVSTIDAAAVDEVNIEGAATINDNLVLSNRANKTHRNNSFIITMMDSSGIKTPYKTRTVLLPKRKNILGISGLTYVKEKDLMLFTASTENTPDAYTDGEIGSSYIGYIKNISKKLNERSVKATKLICISKHLGEKSAQKIESIAVEETKRKKIIIHLAADNDNGESTLFKLTLNR